VDRSERCSSTRSKTDVSKSTLKTGGRKISANSSAVLGQGLSSWHPYSDHLCTLGSSRGLGHGCRWHGNEVEALVNREGRLVYEAYPRNCKNDGRCSRVIREVQKSLTRQISMVWQILFQSGSQSAEFLPVGSVPSSSWFPDTHPGVHLWVPWLIEKSESPSGTYATAVSKGHC